MFDVVVCTNLVNLTVALHGVRPGSQRPALLLYESRRFLPPVLPRVLARRFGVWWWRWLRAAVALRLVHTLYLPHDRFTWRLRWCRDRCRSVVYLDDGLDTHRLQPRNLDLDRLPPEGAGYLTFDEFVDLPAWLSHFQVRRIGPVALIAQTGCGPAIGLEGARHVFVESPGLDVTAVVRALSLADDEVVVVRHPVPSKRVPLDSRWRAVEGVEHNLEATLLGTRGVHWYFGETMVLLFAVHAAGGRGHRLHVQLSVVQRESLRGLRLTADARLDGLYLAS